MNVKQVLVWRTDLKNTDGHKVRSGKMAAQLAHASMAAILADGEFDDIVYSENDVDHQLTLTLTPAMKYWLENSFTKVCVQVNSEQHLLDLYQQAVDAGIPCSLIKDNGTTEFGGVKTHTAVAIGPAEASDIDNITGGLSLL